MLRIPRAMLISLARYRLTSRTTRGVKRKKIVRCQVLAFPTKSAQQSGPVVRRDAFPLPPLADSPMTLTNVVGHFGDAAPAVKDVFYGLHPRDIASDELSGQGRPIIPMTETTRKRTIRPMGRGTTPARFRAEMAERLKAARVVAGFETQLEAAQALGVGLDRYRKWESGPNASSRAVRGGGM